MDGYIIAFFNMKKDNCGGWIDDGKQYIKFRFENGVFTQDELVDKSAFKNYDHFTGVMGKFNPYQLFIAKPVKIKNMDLSIFKKKYSSFRAMFPGYPE